MGTAKEPLFRLARTQDLPDVVDMYRAVVAHMLAQSLAVWDEVYPVCCLAEDIARQQLYLLRTEAAVCAASALYPAHAGVEQIGWAQTARAFYLDRFAVHPSQQGRGLGQLMLHHAAELARAQQAEALRLFVVEHNAPAIGLYRKCVFVQMPGCYAHAVDESLTLRELGMEKQLCPANPFSAVFSQKK